MKAPITVGIPPHWKAYKITRDNGEWRLWIHTRDYIDGTYIVLHNDGMITRVTARPDEGDQIDIIKPKDNT